LDGKVRKRVSQKDRQPTTQHRNEPTNPATKSLRTYMSEPRNQPPEFPTNQAEKHSDLLTYERQTQSPPSCLVELRVHAIGQPPVRLSRASGSGRRSRSVLDSRKQRALYKEMRNKSRRVKHPMKAGRKRKFCKTRAAPASDAEGKRFYRRKM